MNELIAGLRKAIEASIEGIVGISQMAGGEESSLLNNAYVITFGEATNTFRETGKRVSIERTITANIFRQSLSRGANFDREIEENLFLVNKTREIIQRFKDSDEVCESDLNVNFSNSGSVQYGEANPNYFNKISISFTVEEVGI